MSHPPASTSLHNVPLAKLQELANESGPVESLSPKAWFEKARFEAEKAIMAERFNKPEELFVAYLRAIQYYTKTRSHLDFNEVKKKDPAWASRVKDFKEVRSRATFDSSGRLVLTDKTYEAFLGKAKALKEKLRERQVERSPPQGGQASSSDMSDGVNK
jgi:ubiquitin carboxyl-terminal hydrolase 8